MKNGELERLAALNQISLDDGERESVHAFFVARAHDTDVLKPLDTEGVEMTVHVMPVAPSLREDEVSQPFSREEMQSVARLTDAGYYCVPRVLE